VKPDGTQGKISVMGDGQQVTAESVTDHMRGQAVSIGYQALKSATHGDDHTAKREVEQLAEHIRATMASHGFADGWDDADAEALTADVGGRMTKALTGSDRFQRWGRHYLRAIVRAHQMQLNTNFMDTGVQVYGGALFNSLKDRGSEIFTTLPPPVPSRSAPVYPAQTPRGTPVAAAPPSPPSPSTYYQGGGGGCFGSGSSVDVMNVDGYKRTKIADVRAGDEVCTASGTAKVRCAVKLHRNQHSASKRLIRFDCGLTITPDHPVYVDGEWRRPRELGTPVEHDGWVYNLVLDKCHILIVDGVQCVTFGHGIRGPVVEHAYWGTDMVLKDLAAQPGWDEGFVMVSGSLQVQEPCENHASVAAAVACEC